MQRDFSDETLMAFADGVLDEPQFSQVAEAIESDETLAARLEALVTGSALARRGFDEILAPVSPELEAAVRETIKAAERKPFWKFSWSSWIYPAGAFAAAVVAFVVVIPFIGLWQASPTPSSMAELSGQEVAVVLNTLPSGGTTTLASGTVINPIATFTNGDQQVCREFETQGSASYLVVACRAGSSWAVQLALATANEDGNYRPASGFEVLDSYLESVGAGEPLTGDDELTALRGISP
ncbi:anti-sigma factor family protein [Devosia sp. LjRoot3]|uniref:anti-sigma factor family protein n=1 Tax=Devosia sp. LjRoot3 TaxID=3342319 RepID=UPI003ED0B14F